MKNNTNRSFLGPPFSENFISREWSKVIIEDEKRKKKNNEEKLKKEINKKE